MNGNEKTRKAFEALDRIETLFSSGSETMAGDEVERIREALIEAEGMMLALLAAKNEQRQLETQVATLTERVATLRAALDAGSKVVDELTTERNSIVEVTALLQAEQNKTFDQQAKLAKFEAEISRLDSARESWKLNCEKAQRRAQHAERDLKVESEKLGASRAVVEFLRQERRDQDQARLHRDLIGMLDGELISHISAFGIPTPVEGFEKAGFGWAVQGLRSIRDKYTPRKA